MIHLKLKSEFSYGRAYAKLEDLIIYLKETDCVAAALVDTTTWGHIPFHQECRAAGIKPILGVELFVVFDDVPKCMWFLARDAIGLRELYSFVSLSHKQQHPLPRGGMIPVLYPENIKEMSWKIIKFAGDVVDGEFLKSISAVIDYNPSSQVLNLKKRRVAKDFILLEVETSDNAYIREEDHSTYEVLTGSLKKHTPQHILEKYFFQSEIEELCDDIDDYDLPIAPMLTHDADLEALCRQGAQRRFPQGLAPEYEARLQLELAVIRKKTFESYFLIVADLITFAKTKMLVGPGRGSSAGSLVCYLCGITEVDPIPPGLYFERFIDISRSDLPDIDTDFPDNKRHLILEYLREKYGADKIAQIGTLSTLQARSALALICKQLHISGSIVWDLRSAIKTTLLDALENTPTGAQFLARYPHMSKLAHIEGHISHTGKHAAGVLLSQEDIKDFCVLDDQGIAHIDKHAAEKLGLLKVDILGLRTLTILEDSGIDIDWYKLPLDELKTFKLLNSKNFCGIFQLDGKAARKISKGIHFRTIEDVCDVIALARPGTLDSGIAELYLKRVQSGVRSPIHPFVDQILDATYGLPIYQEQTLAIVREIGQLSWEETNSFRKGIGKSLGSEFINSFFKKFKIGAEDNGLSETEIAKVWGLICEMGGYQMNKSHTYSYAIVAYWTAYLKTHHPLEFLAATLRHQKDEDASLEIIREMTKTGIKFKPFDADDSEVTWSSKNDTLFGGFTSLKGVGDIKAKKLVEKRNTVGLTQTDRDFLQKCENKFSNLFPLKSKYSGYYKTPNEFCLSREVSTIEQLENIPHGEERIFIATLTKKILRDKNDPDLLEKRSGVLEKGQTKFVDVRFKDDTGEISGRISNKDYVKIGKEFFEKAPIDSELLVKSVFYNGFRFAFLTRWKRLDE
jgi:DNA polymerase III alpha subunit